MTDDMTDDMTGDDDSPDTVATPPPPTAAYFPAFTPAMPPPLIGQGNWIISPLLITSGGFGEPRTKTGGDFPATFPDFTAGTPPIPAGTGESQVSVADENGEAGERASHEDGHPAKKGRKRKRD